jgi:hypothetical protein
LLVEQERVVPVECGLGHEYSGCLCADQTEMLNGLAWWWI